MVVPNDCRESQLTVPGVLPDPSTDFSCCRQMASNNIVAGHSSAVGRLVRKPTRKERRVFDY